MTSTGNAAALTSDFLQTLHLGSRFRFALHLAASASCLVVLDENAEYEDFLAHISQPDPAKLLGGTGWIASDGSAILAGEDLDREAYATLARWVTEQAVVHKGLRGLAQCRMLNLGPDGSVIDRVEGQDRWGGMSRAPFRGTLPHTVRTLQRLAPEEPGWFYATDKTASGPAHILLVPQSKDEAGSHLARLASCLRVEGMREISGVLRLTSNGCLCLLVQDIDLARDVLGTALSQLAESYPPLAVLADVQLISVGADGATAAKLARVELVRPPVDLGHADQILATLAAGERAYLVFTTGGSEDVPVLWLSLDKAAFQQRLRESAQARPGQILAGTLTFRGKRGVIDTRSTQRGAAAHLARFLRRQGPRWPNLDRLDRAQIRRTGADNQVLYTEILSLSR